MLNHWILITLSWLGTARPQYISTGDQVADIIHNPQESVLQSPLPYVQYFDLPPTRNNYKSHDENFPESYHPEEFETDQLRNRRDAEEKEVGMGKRTPIHVADTDRTVYFRSGGLGTPIVVEPSRGSEEKSTSLLKEMDKKYFSPWGGKRDQSDVEHTWTWKRGSAAKEPSMPKRVRFSPWGGKRSGQMIVKPGQTKVSRTIHSTNLPALTRIVSSYLPSEQLKFAGYQFIHSLDRRHPIKILSLSTSMDERILREPMPFHTFLGYLPKMYKPGHPYQDVNLKKDGKRKVKFSAWGGKRSPPIIGPIWTPVPNDMKDSTLNTVILIRNNEDKKPTL